MSEQDGWVGIEEIANYLGVNKDTIRNWIKKVTFQHVKLGDNGNLKKVKLTLTNLITILR